ncbi:kinesin-like protein KIF18A [Chelonus insularis]|uniref:kinesin-like protein KIF18A n=1 Tax=Chelonus insularis TaxID=460826 RepID=UPI00158B52EF|nr:kinesin-like protein KIF18A [Chelonus insularis]
MVLNKRDLEKAFSPNKVKRLVKRPGINPAKPSTSGSTSMVLSDDDQTSIKVVVRIRPPNEKEQQENFRNVIKTVDTKMLIFDPKEEENPFFYRGIQQRGRDLLKKQNKELQFMFDRVFDMTASNAEIFDGTTKEIISDLLEGYNCSVFAYGATGAGKTHTMLGKDDDPGITFRTMAELFTQIEEQSEHRDFNLGVTYLEIYNENVQDLLNKSGPLALREDGRSSVIVAGLKIKTINSSDELLSLLAYGNKNRTQHPTDANAESSRSHAVFQVYINITNKLDGQVKQVKLSMIDLAGSERASATGCKGARLKEGANINKSLLALGNCINKLAEGIKHIPYRDSKLTRLLKDSLGGNCRTVMIANIGPSSLTYEDTYNTLRYANRAKKIKTHMKKNIISCEMHVTGYIKLVEEQKKEINLLKQKLAAIEGKSTPKKSSESENEEMKKEIKELKEKMIELLERKRSLNEKILVLQSSDKILCCRIQHKLAADKRLQNLTMNVDLIIEEQNASGKSRVNKSLLHFKRQRDIVKTQMVQVWNELQEVEQNINTLNNEIRTKGFVDKLIDTCAYQKSLLDCLRSQQQYEHARKVCSLQLCELESLETINKMTSSTLQSYYNMMRGYGTMTDKMKAEFKHLVKSLEGVRNIKWADADLGNSQDSYSLTCLSIDQLLDPINNEMPIHSASYLDEDGGPISPNSGNNIVDKTFNTSPSSDLSKTEVLDSTITFSDQDSPTVNVTMELNGSTGIDVAKLNNTFSLIENKSKKRVLNDKSAIGSKPPAKQPRRISPKTKTTLTHTNGIAGKENKSTQRHITSMTAKSVSIINKLKTDRSKPVPQLSTANLDPPLNTSDSLKAVRSKERRGISASHPYQKNVKPKVNSTSNTSRVPW